MIVIFLLTGLAAGVLSGIFGIGGGILIVPALVYFGDMSIKTATGTSLGALLLPVGLLGALTYYQTDQVNIRAALLVSLGLFIGAYFGARIAQTTPPALLQRGFAVLLVAVAIRMWLKA